MQDEISWKKIRAKSGGHLYHHIHELDCTLFIMDETPSLVSMAAGNVAHKGEKFGDEDDVVLITLSLKAVVSRHFSGDHRSTTLSTMY